MPTDVRRAMARLLLVVVPFVGFGALAPTAHAQPKDSSICVARTEDTARSGLASAAAATTLLPADGVGFFGPDVDRVIVQRSDEDVDYLDAATAVQTLLTIFYARRGMVALDNSRVEALEPGAIVRIVVIDGDVALRGDPSIVELDDARTLFLHWQSALDDLNTLLDVPRFAAMPVGEDEDANDDCHVDQTAFDDVADNLAFIEAEIASAAGSTAVGSDDADSVSTVPIDDVVQSVPLGDTAANKRWPYLGVGAALLAGVGAMVLYRRGDVSERDTPVTAAPKPAPAKPSHQDHAVAGDLELAINSPVDVSAHIDPVGITPRGSAESEQDRGPVVESEPMPSSQGQPPALAPADFSALVNEEHESEHRGDLFAHVAALKKLMGEDNRGATPVEY